MPPPLIQLTDIHLTFGGTLRAERVEGEVICVFESPAPLLRRGGHSQGWDSGARSVGGFFGRFRAAAGYEHAYERLAAEASPVARYAAFVAEAVERFRGSGYLRDQDPRLWTLMLAEERRLQRDHAQAWKDGVELLRRTRAVTAVVIERLRIRCNRTAPSRTTGTEHSSATGTSVATVSITPCSFPDHAAGAPAAPS